MKTFVKSFAFTALITFWLLPLSVRAQGLNLSLEDYEELENNVTELVENCMPACVGLGSKIRLENGSAVIVSKDGLMLTAYHVIDGHPDDDLIVSFVDGKQARAKKLGGIPGLDIAMVQITDEGEYPFCEVGDMKQVHRGDWCVSISHAGGFQSDRTPPVRLGQILVKRRGNFFQMTNTLIGGDSGGPTFDLEGRVIGIHSNIGGGLDENQACPISNFTKNDHWDRMLAGEVWGLGAPSPTRKRQRPNRKKDDTEEKSAKEKPAEEKPAEEKPAEEKPAEEKPVDEKDTPAAEQPEDDGGQVDEKESAQKESAEENPNKPKETEIPNPRKRPTRAQQKERVEAARARIKAARDAIRPAMDALDENATQYRNSIVRFWRRGRNVASGVVVSDDGLIVTKSSELLGRNFEIELPNKERVRGEIIKRVPENDLLFVKVDVDDESELVAAFSQPGAGDNASPQLGSIVAAVGFGGETIAMGVKSVEVRNLTEAGYSILGVNLGSGKKELVIEKFKKDSAARQAGLRVGDKLTGIGGEEITTQKQLQEKLKSLKPNSPVPVQFERDGGAAAVLMRLQSSLERADRNALNYSQGGRISRQRLEFTQALQTDVAYEPSDAGTVLVDLKGNLLGLNIARAGRIKSYTLPYKTIRAEIEKLDQ